MDKETLSNYGWVTIVTLVLAVMLALSTPFGNYVGDGVISIARGYKAANESKMSEDSIEGMSNRFEKKFDGTYKTVREGVIPVGGTYTPKGATPLNGDGSTTFPTTPQTGDTYKEGDYKYTYNKGNNYGAEWSVSLNLNVTDKEKTTYGEILSEIAGKPVTHMYQTFFNCTSLITAPIIPNSITDMGWTFSRCTSLTTAPAIPNSVTVMTGTFDNCTALSIAPEIPNSVLNMRGTFAYCSSLTTAPEIPNSVEGIYATFMGCTSLTGTITINANPTYYDRCFERTTLSIILTGSSSVLSAIAGTATNGNVTVG